MKAIKIGMIGTGFIADWHHEAFASLPDVEFAALCHEPHGNAEKTAVGQATLHRKCKEWGIAAYESYDAMLADESLDAVIIGSINPCHFGQITAGLKAGKHLLVEKPVVTSFDELDQIAAAAKACNKIVFPGHNFVYRNAVQKAKSIIESGALGKIVYSTFVSSHNISEGHAHGWRSKKALSKGGALMDSGHHLVYQLLYLLGMPVALHAFCSKLALQNMECEDTAHALFKFKDGSTASVMQSWASGVDHDISGIRILGDKGCLVISDALYHDGKKIDDDVEYGSSFARQARAFVDAIRNGSAPASTLDDARNALKLIYAAYHSAECETPL